MINEWRPIINRLIDREGGGVEHPNDLGGATRYGITLNTYRSILNRLNATEAELRGLTREQVAELYYRHWVLHPKLQLHLLYPLAVGEVVLDTAVLFGRARAGKWLQGAVNMQRDDKLKIDGWIGPATRSAVTMCNYSRLISDIVDMRIMRHARRVQERPDQAVFLAGWIGRAIKMRGVA